MAQKLVSMLILFIMMRRFTLDQWALIPCDGVEGEMGMRKDRSIWEVLRSERVLHLLRQVLRSWPFRMVVMLGMYYLISLDNFSWQNTNPKPSSPGRFFASQQLKLTLAYIALNYEIQRIPSRPENSWFVGSSGPPLGDTVYVRRRPGTFWCRLVCFLGSLLSLGNVG